MNTTRKQLPVRPIVFVSPACSLNVLVLVLLALGVASARGDVRIDVRSGSYHVGLGSGVYPDGMVVRVRVAPEVGHRFVRWEGDVPVGREAMDPLEFVPAGDSQLVPVVEPSPDPWAGWVLTRVVAWGDNSSRQTEVPAGVDRVRAIAAGSKHSLALGLDGTLVGWGAGFPDFAGIFQLGGRAKAVGATSTRTLLLLEDGRVMDVTPYPITQLLSPTLPGGLTQVRSLVANGHSDTALVLLGDGRVVPHLRSPRPLLETPPWVNSVTVLEVGRSHALALQADGTLLAWGDNQFGQTNVPAGLPPAIGLAAGSVSSLALHANGTVTGWGSVPTEWNLAGLKEVTTIRVGQGGLLALRRDGTVWDETATAVPGLTRVVAISAGLKHNLALRVERVGVWERARDFLVHPIGDHVTLKAAVWGAEALQWYKGGQPLTGETNAVLALPALVRSDSGHYQFAGWDAGAAVSEGTRLCVIDSHVSGLGHIEGRWIEGTGDLQVRAVPAPGWAWRRWDLDPHRPLVVLPQATALGGVEVTAEFVPATLIDLDVPSVGQGMVAGGGAYATGAEATLTAAPEIGWRFDRWSGDIAPGEETVNPLRLEVLPERRIEAVFVPASHPRAGWFEGQPVVWRRNWTVLELAAGPVSAVSANSEADALLLRADGTLARWTASTTNREVTPLPGTTGVVAIGSGPGTHLAVLEDGRVVEPDTSAAPPPPLTNAVEVAAGDRFGVARLADGRVVAWGANWAGQGQPPAGLDEVSTIAAGWGYGLAVRADGTLVHWGLAQTSGPHLPPSDLTGVVAASGQTQHTLALLEDGSVRGWGSNLSAESRLAPGFNEAMAVAAGADHSVILTRDGTVLVWGNQEFSGGQPPAGLRDVVAVAAGKYFGLALVGTEVGLARPEPQARFLRRGQRLVLHPVFHAALAYAWYKDGRPLPGQVSPWLKLGPVGPEDSGVYCVVAFGRHRALSARTRVSVESDAVRLRLELDRALGEARLQFDPPLPGSFWLESAPDLRLWQPIRLLTRGVSQHALPWNGADRDQFFRLRQEP